MFLKLQTILKRRVHPYVLLAAGLTVATLVTVLSGLWHHNYELSHQIKSSGLPTVTAQPAQAASVGLTVETQPTTSSANPQAFSPSNRTSSNAQTQADSGQVAAASSPNPQAPAPAPQTSAEVSLSVNGNFKGKVAVLSGSSQCAVLQKAFDTGVISNLDMRYSTQYKTYAVYVIDGVGDSSAIWWTYTVNGKSPPYGCSGMKVADGDLVNWKYVKQ